MEIYSRSSLLVAGFFFVSALLFYHHGNTSAGVRSSGGYDFKASRRLWHKPQVIKGRGKAIYIVEGGYKHLIPDWDTYTDLGFDANDVKLVSDQELMRIPDGAPVKAIGDRQHIDPGKICPCESISRQSFAIKANMTVAPHKVCIIANKASDKLFTEYYDPTYLMQHLKVKFVSEQQFKHHEEVARWNMYDQAVLSGSYSSDNDSMYEGLANLDHMKYASSVTGIEYVDKPTPAPTTAPGEEPKAPLSKLGNVEESRHPHKPETDGYDSDKDPYPSQYFFNKNEEGSSDEPGKGAWSTVIDWSSEAEGGSHRELEEIQRRRLLIQRNMVQVDDQLECDVTLEIMDDGVPLRSHVCPGICLPHPRAIIPLDILRPTPKNPSLDLTCSMRLDSIFPGGSGGGSVERQSSPAPGNMEGKVEAKRQAAESEKADGPDKAHARLAILLQAIGRRKIEECLEREYWTAGRKQGLSAKTLGHHPTHTRDPPKRRVRGLIIWIGSLTRFGLARRQIDVLKSQATPEETEGKTAYQVSEEQIVGWLATEEVYPCRRGSTLCDSASSHQAYFQDMPQTRLNMASGGYSCAQRRPLRSLAHTLRLFDPTDFVMVVDDDTYVNIDMLKLGTPLSKYISDSLSKHHFVVGELTNGKKITSKGFFYGGAGYLVGKAVLDRLTSHRVMAPPEWQIPGCNPVQTAHLQMLTEVVRLSNQSCAKDPTTGGDTCLVSTTKLQWEDGNPNADNIGYGFDHYATLNEDTTMVDVCMNVMAEEHSCYHSDHSLSRCFVHGVYAQAVNQWCGSRDPYLPPSLPNPGGKPGPKIGMCMEVDGQCYSDVHFTCHHWMPDDNDYRKAVPAKNLQKYDS